MTAPSPDITGAMTVNRCLPIRLRDPACAPGALARRSNVSRAREPGHGGRRNGDRPMVAAGTPRVPARSRCCPPTILAGARHLCWRRPDIPPGSTSCSMRPPTATPMVRQSRRQSHRHVDAHRRADPARDDARCHLQPARGEARIRHGAEWSWSNGTAEAGYTLVNILGHTERQRSRRVQCQRIRQTRKYGRSLRMRRLATNRCRAPGGCPAAAGYGDRGGRVGRYYAVPLQERLGYAGWVTL